MLNSNFSYLSNYICRESVRNLNRLLTEGEARSFSYNDYYYLTTIYYMGRPNLSQLADELGLTRPAVTVMTGKLKNLGLIEKVQSDGDKRVYFLSVTEKGKEIVEGDKALYDHLSALIKGMVPDAHDYELVDSLLTGIVNKLKEGYMDGEG